MDELNRRMDEMGCPQSRSTDKRGDSPQRSRVPQRKARRDFRFDLEPITIIGRGALGFQNDYY